MGRREAWRLRNSPDGPQIRCDTSGHYKLYGLSLRAYPRTPRFVMRRWNLQSRNVQLG